MPKLNHKEIVETFIKQQDKILSCCDQQHLFFSMLCDLNRDELKEIKATVDPDNGLYDVLESMLHSMPDKSLCRAELKDLLRWFKECTKGKVAPARTILKSRYDYLSTRERREIVDAFLNKNKPSDRKWVYKKLDKEWDETYKEKIKALWEAYHEDDCGMLIIRHFDLPYVIEQRDELDNDKSHYWLNIRLAQNPLWEINNSKLSPIEFLRLVCYSKRPVSDDDVRISLYRIISNIVIEKKRLDLSDDELPDGSHIVPIPFEITTYDYDEVEKALWYIGKAGYVSIVMEYATWVRNNTLYDQTTSRQRSKNYYEWMSKFSDKDRQIAGEEQLDLLYMEFYANIIKHFPKEYKWMLDDADPELKGEFYLECAAQGIDGVIYGNRKQALEQEEQDKQWEQEERKQPDTRQLSVLTPEETYKMLDEMRNTNDSIDKLVKGLGLEPVV